MRTIAIINQKGGTGKTTATVNLSAALGEQGHKVLVVDLDGQSNTTDWIAGPEARSRGLFDLLTGDEEGSLADLAAETPCPGVDLVASSPYLVGAERAMSGQVGAEMVLKRAVSALPRDRWDFVIFDCPPSLGLLSASALGAAREVLVPLPADTLALSGLAQLLQTLKAARERLNKDLELSGIMISRCESRTNLSKQLVADLRERFGDVVLQTQIPETVRLREAPSHHKPVTSYARTSLAAEAYRAAAAELVRRGVANRGNAVHAGDTVKAGQAELAGNTSNAV